MLATTPTAKPSSTRPGAFSRSMKITSNVISTAPLIRRGCNRSNAPGRRASSSAPAAASAIVTAADRERESERDAARIDRDRGRRCVVQFAAQHLAEQRTLVAQRHHARAAVAAADQVRLHLAERAAGELAVGVQQAGRRSGAAHRESSMVARSRARARNSSVATWLRDTHRISAISP
jgi:hypothetical protein